jgi:hypothetical protein
VPSSWLNGELPDVEGMGYLVNVVIDSIIVFLPSHASYVLFWKR